MPTFNLDGKDVEFEKGETILDVCHRRNTEVPHYCWHPGLTIAGNCRICMVEVEGRPGTTIACNTQAMEGMVVRTNSDRARGAQQDVMELLLINHPLDCPICDQAGECKLQEYSYEHGSDHSRFEFAKVHKPKNVRFSDKITFDAERCILCTRCVRFGEEISGDDELDIVNRGDRNEIAVARGGEMTSDYQLNTVDICPVGALTSTDFRFKSRVWFLKQTRTVCGSCSRGCNTIVGARWNKIQRMVPAENQAVNKWWMCDDGRLNYKHVAADDRIGAPMIRKGGQLVEVTWDEALDAAAEGLRAAGENLHALVSARLTNEELFLASTLLDAVGTAKRAYKPRTWEKDDLLRTGDGNPNAKGAELLGFTSGGSEITGSAAFLCGEDLDDSPELLEKLKSMDFVLSIDFAETDTVTQAAHVVLPGVTHFEKEGSFTNVDGRVQRIDRCVEAPGDAMAEWWILGALRQRVEGVPAPRTVTELSRALCDAVPAFHGRTLGKLGRLGLDLAEGDGAAVTADDASAGEGS